MAKVLTQLKENSLCLHNDEENGRMQESYRIVGIVSMDITLASGPVSDSG